LDRKKHIINGQHLVSCILLFFAFLLISVESKAQQDPMYTQYMDNLHIINPAYAGSKDLLSLMVVARNQWVSLPGAPETRTLAAHSPMNGTQMGLGISFLSDHVGPVKQTGMYFDYSYRLYFSNQRTLALGLKGGVNFYEANISNLSTNDPNDPVFVYDINRRFLPNVGVGAFFYTNQYYLGLSIPKLIDNAINKNSVSVQYVSREKMHVFFMAGYVYDVNRIVKFKPAILAKYVMNTPFSIDLSGTFLFYERLWLGAMYRLGDSFGGLFQLQVTNQIKIGYSYDLPINQLGAYNNGTHEIMISFDFVSKGGKVRSPRYF
jgi:type IX secretion system PorP/SprF family membrane protein